MTKARDLANIISGGFTESDIPNLSASKITSGTFADARIADLSASKLTGSIADARIPASAVSQHATSFDDNKLVNDISTLALRQASNENKGAYNTNSMYVDVFQDDTGIASHTTSARNASEYVSSVATGVTNTAITLNASNYTTYIDTDVLSNVKTTTSSPARQGNNRFNPELASNANLTGGSAYIPDTIPNTSQEKVVLGHLFGNSSSNEHAWQNTDTSATYRVIHHNMRFKSGVTFTPTHGGNAVVTWKSGNTGLHTSQGFLFWGVKQVGTGEDSYSTKHILAANSGGLSNGTTYTYSIDNASNANSYDSLVFRVMHLSDNTYFFNNVSLVGTANVTALVTSATGNFISNVITAPSSTSKMGAIITYQDQAGTNSLNTDVVLQLSADNGSTFQTATLTAMPDFSTGIKMAKVNDLAVTAGTQLKYKVLFANQSSGSKEARIRGVSLQY